MTVAATTANTTRHHGCTTATLDRALLRGLGLSAAAANLVMEHIEELREDIKKLHQENQQLKNKRPKNV